MSQIDLIMEYFEGPNLKNYLIKKGRLPESHVSFILKQLVQALNHCHSRGIYHLDVKPENILVNSNLKIKMIDFAFAVRQVDDSKIKKFCGTPSYMAPEIHRKEHYQPAKADVWALGVITYRLFTGKAPFKGKQPGDVLKEIEQFNIDRKMLDEGTHELRDFLSKTMRRKPAQRLTLKEVV